jgi:hypothetical protein
MMKDMAQSFLEDRDLSVADVPVFLIIHTALSVALVSSTWYLCHQQQQQTFLTRRVQKLTTSAISSNKKIQRLLNDNTASIPNKRIQRLLKNTDATKLATSFVEAKVGRLVVKPITIPARLWLSWQGTLAWKETRKKKPKQ